MAPTDSLKSIAIACKKLSAYYKAGLGALLPADKKHIKVPEPKSIVGSLALDRAAAGDLPEDFRWDYLLDYGGEIFFIEIHPASTSEINRMIGKVDAVRRWLDATAPAIFSLPPRNHKYYWVSSGNTRLRLTPGSPQAHKLAANKIVSVGQIWNYTSIRKTL